MTTQVSKASKFYTNLLSHCNKQYKNIAEIHKAYVVSGQVVNIDYTSTTGANHISSGTAYAERVISFTN